MAKTPDEDWTDENLKEMDLLLENQSLETDLSLKGGVQWKSESIDPKLENAFLKSVLAFEEAAEGPGTPIRSFFPETYTFPPADTMGKKVLSAKLDDIRRILSEHNIELSFANKLPDAVLYTYLVEEVIPNESAGAETTAGFILNLDGCTGGCDECFQKAYCSTAKEIEEDEKLNGGRA